MEDTSEFTNSRYSSRKMSESAIRLIGYSEQLIKHTAVTSVSAAAEQAVCRLSPAMTSRTIARKPTRDFARYFLRFSATFTRHFCLFGQAVSCRSSVTVAKKSAPRSGMWRLLATDPTRCCSEFEAVNSEGRVVNSNTLLQVYKDRCSRKSSQSQIELVTVQVP